MRLITFQDKYVLNSLENKNIYECNKIFFESKYNDLYNKFTNRMKESLGIDMNRRVIPIWCWVIQKDLELNIDIINELYDREIPKCNNLVMLELDVPKEFLFISNYDLWSDYLFRIVFENKLEFSYEEIDKLFEKVKGAKLQASIPFITKEFIKSSKIFNNYIDRDYTQTDEWIAREKKKRGEDKFDKDFCGD